MKTQLIKFLSTGLGVGYVPLIPGTVGSLWGVLIYYLLRDYPSTYLGITAAGITIVAVFVAEAAEKLFQTKDCQKIVIDEVAGQLVAYLLVPYSFTHLVIGFMLFRFFDIVKLFPAGWAQRRIPGGRGIVADDLFAGLQAALILLLLHRLIPSGVFFKFSP